MLAAWPARSLDLNSLNLFLWVCMKSSVYHDGEEKEWHQLVESINEATVAIINELERIPWQHSELQ